MSNKVQTFANYITQPLNIHNFQVDIPGVPYAIVVESTTFPSEKLRTIELWFQGEKVRYPGLPENDGTWKVKIPESDDGKIKKQFDALKSPVYNQVTGIMTPKQWKNITVTARDLEGNIVFYVILHGCWIKGRDPINLSATDPSQSWKWDYEFVYQWIEDLDAKNAGTPNPS